MSSMLMFLILLVGTYQAADEPEIGIIKDPDGYTNLRSEPNIDSEILRQISQNDFLWFIRSGNPWWEAANSCPLYTFEGEGYIHSSRIVPITDMGIPEIEKLYNSEWKKEKNEVRLENIEAIMFNAERIDYEGPCFIPESESAYLEIFIPGQKPIRKYYPNIHSLGGYGGIISSPVLSYPEYLFFTKHGDYDGRAIIVRKDGKVADIDGGRFLFHGNYFISETGTGCCGEPVVWDLSLWEKTWDSRDDNSIMDRYKDGQPQYSYYIASGELFLKVENPYNEDTKPSYYLLDNKGKFIPESNPPVLEEKVKMLPKELSHY